MILPKQQLRSGSFFENLHDSQYQPAGVDVTLKEVYAFKSAGRIDFDNRERVLSRVEQVPFGNEQVVLKEGAYKVVFNEYVRIPSDVAGMCLPRSSLLRCGISLECAVWDPGYEGRSEALLVVRNPHGAVLKRNAKVGQMVFIRLAESASELYKGQYKGENQNR